MACIAGRAVLLLSLIILGPACSFVFVEGVPDYHRGLPPEEPVDCTSSRAAPMIDTMLASALAVSTAVAANANESYEGESVSQDANVAANVVATAVFAGSAIYGYVTIGKCYDAKATRAERLRRAWRRTREEQRKAKRADDSRRRVIDSEDTPAAPTRDRATTSEDQSEPELSEEALERWGGPNDGEP